MANTKQATESPTGVNVRVPERVHRLMRIVLAAENKTWNEAATEAFETWAKARMPREVGR